MTRRLAYWIIGTALGMAPLAGCAQWGKSRLSPESECPGKCRDGSNTTSREPPNPPTNNSPLVHESKVIAPTSPAKPEVAAIKEPAKNSPADLTLDIKTASEIFRPLPRSMPTQTNPKPPLPPEVKPPASTPDRTERPAQAVRREPLVEAMQCVLDDRHPEALQWLRKYDQSTQEVFLRLLPVMALMSQKSIDALSPSEVAVLNEQLQSLSSSLRPRSQLSIDKACFCESIKSFGIYKPLPEGHAFLGSTPNRPGELVQLYVELRNFASDAKNGSFATRLSSSVEIRDQKGEQVWLYRFEDGKQPIRSRTMLHDYFNNYSFYVPNNLPAGTYTLLVQVTDETRPDQPRVASKALEFRVTSMSARVP